MALYFGATEITNIDNLVPQMGLDITDLWFGKTNVYTVWAVYEGTLPATINANGDDMRQHQLYGNTGGVGDRTINFFDYRDYVAEHYISSSGVDTASSQDPYHISVRLNHSDYISVLPNESYTISAHHQNMSIATVVAIAWYDKNKIFISRSSTTIPKKEAGTYSFTATAPQNAKFAIFNFFTDDVQGVMFVPGTTPPEAFVPFGYEVDMSVSDGTTSTTTSIYIGSDPLEKDEYVDYQAGKVYRRTAQLFNKSTVTIDSFISLDGEEPNAKYCYSDFIPISEGSYYLKNVVGVRVQNTAVVYDANKSALRYANISGSYATKGIVTFTDGDAYIRVNFASSTNLDTVDIIAGSVEPTEHIPYIAPVDPPAALPALPTCEGATIVDYAGSGTAPEKIMLKYRKEGY